MSDHDTTTTHTDPSRPSAQAVELVNSLDPEVIRSLLLSVLSAALAADEAEQRYADHGKAVDCEEAEETAVRACVTLVHDVRRVEALKP
jgi:hypothetical protein